MKRIILLFTALLFASCASSLDGGDYLSHDFFTALGSENCRIDGVLSLDHFDQNLSGLTYEFYIDYLEKNEAPSAHGIARIIRNADMHHFSSTTDAFTLVLFYRVDRKVFIDNSNTAFLDSIYTLERDEVITDLERFVK
jgi:hypothetical protein